MDQDQTTNAVKMIAFRVGDQEFCVDIMSVREIRGWSPTTPLPNAPGYVRGVINLRGAVVPIIDMSERLMMGRSEPGERHVIVVVDVGGKLAGLLVDAVCEIVDTTGDAIQKTPEIGQTGVEAFISGLINLEKRIVVVIDMTAVLPARGLEAA